MFCIEEVLFDIEILYRYRNFIFRSMACLKWKFVNQDDSLEWESEKNETFLSSEEEEEA